MVGRRARDGSRYKGEGRESGRGSPLWRLIMQSLATRAIEDKMLSHIRPSGKVSRSWDLAVPSQLVKQRPFLPGQERPTAANCAPCSKSKLVSRPDTTKDVYTEQKEKEERRGGVVGIPRPWGRWTVAWKGISDWASSRYLNHVGRKNRNRAHVHLYRYSATFILLLFFSLRLPPLLPPLFPPRSGSLYSSSSSSPPVCYSRLLNFFRSFLLGRVLPLLRSIIGSVSALD